MKICTIVGERERERERERARERESEKEREREREREGEGGRREGERGRREKIVGCGSRDIVNRESSAKQDTSANAFSLVLGNSPCRDARIYGIFILNIR